jgi:hypothetical protein
LNSLSEQIQAIRADLIKLVWYMRGGVTYQEILCMSSKERELIHKLIKENLETTKKTGMPFF